MGHVYPASKSETHFQRLMNVLVYEVIYNPYICECFSQTLSKESSLVFQWAPQWESLKYSV